VLFSNYFYLLPFFAVFGFCFLFLLSVLEAWLLAAFRSRPSPYFSSDLR